MRKIAGKIATKKFGNSCRGNAARKGKGRDRDRDSCKGKGKGKGKKKVNKSFSDSFPHLGRVRLEPFNPIDRTFRSCRVKLVGFFTNMIKCVSHGRFEC